MKFIATKMYTMSNGFVEITKNEYNRIKKARDSLFEILYLETVFNYITENYNEYESELLKIASHMMIFNHESYFEINNQRDLVSRRIINLLTVCKMYNEQKPKYIYKIFGRNSEMSRKILSIDNSNNNTNLSVQTMEIVRDYVQHRGFPIQNLSLSYKRFENKLSDKMRHSVIPKIDIKKLEEDRKIDPIVLKRLTKISKKGLVDIRPLIKEYIQQLGISHEKTRKIMSADIEKWKLIINTILEKISDLYPNVTKTGASIGVLDKDELLRDQFTIFTEYIQRIDEFENKNRFYSNLLSRFATNEIGERNE